MDITGMQRIEAPRDFVWAALNDAETLRRCIPSCESVELLSPTRVIVRILFRIGPIRAKVTGNITLSDLDPPHAYTIAGEGQGGVAGFAKGLARVRLIAVDDDATELHYKADGQAGGKVLKLGQRLIDATVRKFSADFFARLSSIVAADARAAMGQGGPVQAE